MIPHLTTIFLLFTVLTTGTLTQPEVDPIIHSYNEATIIDNSDTNNAKISHNNTSAIDISNKINASPEVWLNASAFMIPAPSASDFTVHYLANDGSTHPVVVPPINEGHREVLADWSRKGKTRGGNWTLLGFMEAADYEAYEGLVGRNFTLTFHLGESYASPWHGRDAATGWISVTPYYQPEVNSKVEVKTVVEVTLGEGLVRSHVGVIGYVVASLAMLGLLAFVLFVVNACCDSALMAKWRSRRRVSGESAGQDQVYIIEDDDLRRVREP